MEHDWSSAGASLDPVKHGACGTATVHGHDPPACVCAGTEYVVKDDNLVLLVTPKAWSTVQANLSHEARMEQEFVEER